MTPRKAVALFISKEIEHQTGLMQQALGEVTLRANRVEALSKVLLLYQPRESVAPDATMASIATNMVIDARCDRAVKTEASDGVALSAGESEGDVTPVASLSPTALEGQSEPAADAGHSLATTWQSEPEPLDPTIEAIYQQGLKELDAIAADPAPVVSQSEASPASTALAAPAKRVFQQPLKAADVEALEPEQPARKSVKRVVMPKNKLNPAGILETKEEQPPAVIAKAEPLFDRVMNLWAETGLDFKTIARNAECSVEMISAFVAKARKHNDPRGFARTERGKAPVFKKPIEVSRADGAPISGASQPPVKKPIVEDNKPVRKTLTPEEQAMVKASTGIVTLDFATGRVMAKGIFHAPEWHLRALKKLNDGGMYPLDAVAKAAGSQSVDALITTLPRLAEKLGDIGVTLTYIKNFGVRITRSASV